MFARATRSASGDQMGPAVLVSGVGMGITCDRKPAAPGERRL
jgi:hypothetical protein